MKIKPILTEKSMNIVKKGYYTFSVPNSLTKSQAKKIISEVFDVHVQKVRTINYKGSVSKNNRGKKQKKSGYKKVMVTLAEKEKIAIFKEKGK